MLKVTENRPQSFGWELILEEVLNILKLVTTYMILLTKTQKNI